MASEIGVQTIQHTNGTDAMTIDSAGRVLTPARPAFSVQKNSTQSFGTSETQVTFDNELFDIGANFASNAFTAPVAGIYQFNVGFHFYGLSNDDEARFTIKNGATKVHEVFHQHNADDVGNDDQHVTYSFLLKLSANDAITVYSRTSADTSWTIYGESSSKATFFEGFLVG